jgi:hypothetical protein
MHPTYCGSTCGGGAALPVCEAEPFPTWPGLGEGPAGLPCRFSVRFCKRMKDANVKGISNSSQIGRELLVTHRRPGLFC